MNSEQVLDITRQAMRVAVLLSAPILLFGLVVGLLTNIFQAVGRIVRKSGLSEEELRRIDLQFTRFLWSHLWSVPMPIPTVTPSPTPML